jgi:hypothetical protein
MWSAKHSKDEGIKSKSFCFGQIVSTDRRHYLVLTSLWGYKYATKTYLRNELWFTAESSIMYTQVQYTHLLTASKLGSDRLPALAKMINYYVPIVVFLN